MSRRRFGLGTTAIHGEPHRRPDWSPVAPALLQSTTFVNPVGSDEEVLYTRYGNNPTQLELARKYALLEGAENAVFVASGMGATALAHLAVLRPGDHLVSSAWIYGGTQALFDQELGRFGITVTYVDPEEPRLWKKAVRKETRAIFLETPTNPLMRILDLAPIARVAKEFGLALLVDATFASPVNFRPLEHGADVVIHSATKYLNGHHDVLSGVVLGTVPYIEEVRQKMVVWGQAPDPFACWLLERGLKTLDVRVARQNANALKIAEWCRGRKEVRHVHFPGLEDHPDHEVARTFLDGFGGMLGIELVGGARSAERFLRRLHLIKHAPSLGGVDSVVSEPRFTSHTHLSSDERAALGIPDGFLRLSVGIENADDLIADIEQALK